MSYRTQLINQMADKIERDLRESMAQEPHKVYTNMTAFCRICMETKCRLETRLVAPTADIMDAYTACHDCIKREDIKITDNEWSLEYEAVTVAIQRIKITRPL